MKEAPDKIYIDNRGVYAKLPIFSQIDANVEYIRKDALLEWLEDMRFMANSERAGAYQKVIDKLNEM